MLEFIRDGEVVHAEELGNVDALTLETYEELLSSARSVVFCILVCEATKHVYLASSIVGMRYKFSGGIRIYRLKDPSTRNEVKDVLYFEVIKSPLYAGLSEGVGARLLWRKEETAGNLGGGAQGRNGPVIRALFVGSEADLVHSADLQRKIFRDGERGHSFVSTLLGGITLLASFTLLFFFMTCFFYVLLRFVLLA